MCYLAAYVLVVFKLFSANSLVFSVALLNALVRFANTFEGLASCWMPF